DDIVFLADTDLETLAVRMHDAPVDSRFAPEHAVIIASHLEVEEPAIPESLATPLSPEEYTSLVVHAAVEAENDERAGAPVLPGAPVRDGAGSTAGRWHSQIPSIAAISTGPVSLTA